MTEKFVREVNIDKAKVKADAAIAPIALSLVTYILPLLIGVFDFGVLFEGISFISIIIARIYMSNYALSKARIFIYTAIASIGWILIYDTITLYSYARGIIDIIRFGYWTWITQVLSIVYIVILFLINKDLAKADNPTKYKESTDWFYETKDK